MKVRLLRLLVRVRVALKLVVIDEEALRVIR